MRETQIIERVTERDIDLLLLEELHVSPDFRSWVVSQCFGPELQCARFLTALHSVSRESLGESDLILLFQDGAGRTIALLLENKIDADPQPNQADRYRTRGCAGVTAGDWHVFRTCMMAPRAYLDGTSDATKYDARVSYEEIRDWLRQSQPASPRSDYRATMLQEAIEQNRRGYCAVPDPVVSRFWQDYWRLVCDEFPGLRMKKPVQVAAGSDWIEFRDARLGAGQRIVHKLAKGFIDLEVRLAGDGSHAALEAVALRLGLELARTEKMGMLRMRVPVLNRLLDVSSQLDAVRAGLSAAARLLECSIPGRAVGPDTSVVGGDTRGES